MRLVIRSVFNSTSLISHVTFRGGRGGGGVNFRTKYTDPLSRGDRQDRSKQKRNKVECKTIIHIYV